MLLSWSFLDILDLSCDVSSLHHFNDCYFLTILICYTIHKNILYTVGLCASTFYFLRTFRIPRKTQLLHDASMGLVRFKFFSWRRDLKQLLTILPTAASVFYPHREIFDFSPSIEQFVGDRRRYFFTLQQSFSFVFRNWDLCHFLFLIKNVFLYFVTNTVYVKCEMRT